MLSEKEFIEKIGSTILRLRDKKRFTIENLAGFSGVDYSTINLIENGKRTPTSYTLYKLLYALDIDLTEFFSSESEEREELSTYLSYKIKSLKIPQLKALIEFIDSYELVLKHTYNKTAKAKNK